MRSEVNVIFKAPRCAHTILKMLKSQNDSVFLDVLEDGQIILSGELLDFCQDFASVDEVDNYLYSENKE